MLDDNDDPFPYSVGYAGIGNGAPVLIRPKGSSKYVDWDGRLPYKYFEERGQYEFDGPVYLKFSNFKCTSDGHLHQHLLINGSTAQKKEINAFNDPVNPSSSRSPARPKRTDTGATST